MSKLANTVFVATLIGSVVLSIGCINHAADDARKIPGARDGIELYSLDENGVAVDGYSPVSYFERGKAERGSPDFAVTHEGITYYLTDAAQVESFERSPHSYEPAHGGWCSLMIAGSGNRTRANPESFKTVDGQLLLFWSGDYKGQFISGVRNWNSRDDEMAELRKSNENWARILAGKKKSKIVTF